MTVRDALERYRLDDLVKGKLLTGAGAEDELPNDAYLEESGGPLHYAQLLSFVSKFDYCLHFDYLPTAEDEVRLFQLCNVADADQPEPFYGHAHVLYTDADLGTATTFHGSVLWKRLGANAPAWKYMLTEPVD